MNIGKLDHVALVSEDSAASRDWYMKTFEMEWVYQGLWNNNPFFLKKGDAHIAIFQKGKSSTVNRNNTVRIDHFAFRAETFTDYETAKEDLRIRGIIFKEEDHEISKSIYIQDPDEITIEVTTYDV